jgi:tetratricopeptide (TPR) repeat protein
MLVFHEYHQRVSIALVLLALSAAVFAHGQVEDQIGQLIRDNRIAEAERLVRKMLPTPEAEPKETGGGLSISTYNAFWGIIASRYLSSNDYANAERVARERLKLAESEAPVNPYRTQLFTFVLANTFLTEGKYAMAEPLYQRLTSVDPEADFQVKTFVGMAEVLMAQGRAAEAERFLKPIVFAEGADPARPAAFHEAIFNAYAVALKEAGQSAAADRIVAQIGRETSRSAAIDQQDRDLLRARLLRARGSFDDAEAIYREWMKRWEADPAGSVEARLKPIEEYTHFLTLRHRATDAAAMRVRLRELEKKYNVTF